MFLSDVSYCQPKLVYGEKVYTSYYRKKTIDLFKLIISPRCITETVNQRSFFG